MRKISAVLLFVTVLSSGSGDISAQYGALDKNMSKKGVCPLCGRVWRGRYDYDFKIPDKLPVPSSETWIGVLKEVLALEKLSFAQAGDDFDKFRNDTPYLSVKVQQETQIQFLRDLLKAYGLSDDYPPFPVTRSATLVQAYRNSMAVNRELIRKYEWLLGHAENDFEFGLIETFLLRARINYELFNHALRVQELRKPAY